MTQLPVALRDFRQYERLTGACSVHGMRPEVRRQLPDLLLWAVLAAPVVAGQMSPPLEPGWVARLGASLLVLTAALWLGRRSTRPSAPVAGLALVIVGSIVDGNLSFSVPVLAYLTGRRVAAAWPTAVVFAVIAAGGSALTVGVFGTEPATWFFLATTLLFVGVFPWLIGRYRRQHDDLVTMGWQRADHLERERGMVAAQARLRERARIAREMHDSLGHDLSLLALRAGALELAAGPENRAAAEVRAGVLAATERLREIIGVLHDDDTPAPLTPRDESVGALVARARASGLAVTLTGTGTDPPAVGRAVYRVVQEALTNAARHAPGAPVTVDLVASAGASTVTISNPVPPGTAFVEGFGLAGLREVVRMAGGTITVGTKVCTEMGTEMGTELGTKACTEVGTDQLPGHGFQPSGHAFRVQARLPHVAPPPSPPARPLHIARRRVRRSLVVAVATPVAIAALMSLAYYPFAASGSVMDSATFDALRIGQPRADLPLPGRQVRKAPDEPAPPGATCEYYSDGNFPMASATFRLCFRDGRLISKDRLP
jgi:signal transduction histidine kinase